MRFLLAIQKATASNPLVLLATLAAWSTTHAELPVAVARPVVLVCQHSQHKKQRSQAKNLYAESFSVDQ